MLVGCEARSCSEAAGVGIGAATDGQRWGLRSGAGTVPRYPGSFWPGRLQHRAAAASNLILKTRPERPFGDATPWCRSRGPDPAAPLSVFGQREGWGGGLAA